MARGFVNSMVVTAALRMLCDLMRAVVVFMPMFVHCIVMPGLMMLFAHGD